MGITRLLIYALGLAASALAILGVLDFNPATGATQIHEFNLYEVTAWVAGGGNLLAIIANLAGWPGRRR